MLQGEVDFLRVCWYVLLRSSVVAGLSNLSFRDIYVSTQGRVQEPTKLLLIIMQGGSAWWGVVVEGVALRALECIPRTLAKNSGADATDLLNKLRYKHAEGGPV